MVLKNQTGQSLVEYILLLAVVASLVVTFYNSQAFQRLFGPNGEFGRMVKEDAEFAYRHAFLRNRPANIPVGEREISGHPSYHNTAQGGTRFFSSKEPYP
jgi:hypothetical protein